MKTVGFLAQKGGAGKTTLAVHLAVLAGAPLLDLDPQQSASDWARARSSDQPPVIPVKPVDLESILKAVRDTGIGWAFIDTPPHAQSTVAAVPRFCDLIVIPTRPSIMDLRALGKTFDIVRASSTPAVIVLNACPAPRLLGEARPVREARAVLESSGIPIAPCTITDRADMQHALIDGRSVTEFDPNSKAAAEIGVLWSYLKGVLASGKAS